MLIFELETLAQAISVFVLVALFITFAGTYLTSIADRLADQTGLGEAIVGSVFLGASTSLPGIVTSVAAAYDGHANFAYSNAVGGIAVQTLFLCIADMTYRKSNLEHASVSIPNLIIGVTLTLLLTLPILAYSTPSLSVWGIHPISILLFLVYLIGINLAREAHLNPMWQPLMTNETFPDKPEESKKSGRQLTQTWLLFFCLVCAMAIAGYLLEKSGVYLSEHTVLNESIVGVFFTAIVTSIPELVVTIAAVRQGALTLAVGGIIGGNSFDVLFMTFSDVAYREGSLYHALETNQIFLTALTLILNAVLILGLLRREKYGFGNIGLESISIFTIYILGMSVYVFMS